MYYTINALRIVHELIDGEVVAIDFDTGNYYSMNGTAAQIWEILTCGISSDMFNEIFKKESVSIFLESLLTEGLIVLESTPPENPDDLNSLLKEYQMSQDFQPPVFEKHTDMQHLLLLDPIHDVNEQGWPIPKSDGN